MNRLVTVAVVLGIFVLFFLVMPAMQMRDPDSNSSFVNNAYLRANIANALAKSTSYRVMIAQFYADHGYFPSHINDIDPHLMQGLPLDTAGDESEQSEVADVADDITIANHGDVVLKVRNRDGKVIGTVTLTGEDNPVTGDISWNCHTRDFKRINEFFSQCQYDDTTD